MSDDHELRAAGDRIEGLLAELAAVSPKAGARSQELVQLLMRLYGAGLERILSAIDEMAGPAADKVFSRLEADELVASLLVLHDLHPLDLTDRILRALDKVRPYLGSHGGDVALLEVVDGVARLRLEGSCHGCPSSSVTMKQAIERALEEAVPELAGIEVEGVVPPASLPANPSGLVTLGR